jgi:hypothetical protein
MESARADVESTLGESVFGKLEYNVRGLSTNDVPNRGEFAVAITIVLSGTAVAGGVLESEIVTGGETLILTLAGDVFDPAVGDDNAVTDALIAGITGDDEGETGFNDEVPLTFAEVVRTSDTVVTITLPAADDYAITEDETITVAVPASAVARRIVPTIDTDTFDITEGS